MRLRVGVWVWVKLDIYIYHEGCLCVCNEFNLGDSGYRQTFHGTYFGSGEGRQGLAGQRGEVGESGFG